MKHFAFKLSMSEINTWNNHWTGEDKNYVLIKSVFDDETEKIKVLKNNTPFYYAFSDGWVARVDVKEVSRQKMHDLIKSSDGFQGYAWMVQSILKLCKIDPNFKDVSINGER